ncbi:MAG: hypothetical protein R3247_17045 [Rhodothermales bacterium]|nr:hypothetical protein [Rhodothermales bacterium]
MVYIDRITAMVISTILVLMGFTVQHRAKHSAVEGTLLYVTKTQTLTLLHMLENDLASIGYETPPDEDAILGYQVRPADDILESMEFWGLWRETEQSAPARARIRYTVALADSAKIQGEMVPLFRLTREVNTGGGWSEQGHSPPTLTSLAIDLLNENNTPVAPEQARHVRVRLVNGVVPPLAESLDAAKREAVPTGYRKLYTTVLLSPSNLRGYQM